MKNGKFQFEGEYFYRKRWNGKSSGYEANKYYGIKNGKGYQAEFVCEEHLIFEGDYSKCQKMKKEKYLQIMGLI